MADDEKIEAMTHEQADPVKPGDDHGAAHIDGNALLVDKHGNVRRLPIPSNDGRDPLNFKPWEKAAVIFCCCWFSLLSLALAGGLGPILGTFFAIYAPQGHDPNDIAFLLTLPSLCIGLGNYIILPVSLAFGRRPVFLASTLVLLAATIGAATQDSYSGHLAARVVQGLATGASESLLPLMLTEVTFLHERGRIFGLYWLSQSVFSALLNIVASYINAALGWRWYYWVFVITIAAGLVFSVFGAFETRFSRPVASIDGVVVVTDDFGVTRVIPDDEAQDFLAMEGNGGVVQAAGGDQGGDPSKVSYWERLKPWSKPHERPLYMIGTSWLRMLQCLTSPAIIYAILISSITLGCVIDMSLTYDAVLVGYGWAPESIGLINIGSIVGPILGTAYSVFLGEPFLLWMARRNKGVHKPEHRLLVLVLPAIVGFAMLLLYGFTAQGASTWWGTVLAYTFYNSAWVVVLIVSTTFAAEVVPKHPGPALVMVVGTKNIISFGFTHSLQPMLDRGGIRWAFGVLAGVFGACFLLGIPVYMLNAKWRERAGQIEKKHGITATD